MISRRDYLVPSFHKESGNLWPCFVCWKGFFVLNIGTLQYSETIESKKQQEKRVWPNPREIEYIYTCQFQCNNQWCKNTIYSTGIGEINSSPVFAFDEKSRQDIPISEELYDQFSPKFFEPHLHIFKIHKNVPDKIRRKIHDSFQLFFANPSAAGNSARIALELILDHFGIARHISVKGKDVRLTLEQRIEKFQIENWKETLHALRWLGNDGSHGTIEREDVLDLYDILEKVLNEVFGKETQSILELSKSINDKRKRK